MTIWIKIGITLIAGVLSALFYHMSGLGADGKKRHPWLPIWAFGRQWRRLGCMLFDTAILLLWWHPPIWYGWLILLASMGIEYGMITTYWDWLCGFDNHWLHGFGIGLARLPLYFAGKSWFMELTRAIVLAILMGWVSAASKKDWKEEFGRGAVIPWTAWL